MKGSNQIIKFTPIEEIFSEEEIQKMMMEIQPMLHECFIHSCLFAEKMAKDYPSIEYHEGMFSKLLLFHAWNSVVKDGKRLYFDFSGYFLEKKYKVERLHYAIMLRTYKPKEIYRLIFINGIDTCQIQWDGTYKNYIGKQFRKNIEIIDRMLSLEEKAEKHEEKHSEILCPCLS